ncbi:MAG: fluoride efflux transporter CrcB [Idiomarina sp.]|nr:fluoride efflux transporter CrcB [Idiomarina sp.]
MIWLMIALGGALGAVARFWLTRAISWRFSSTVGATLLANVVGSFMLGFVLVFAVQNNVLNIPQQWRVFIEIGFLGGFTTFATFAVELRSMILSSPMKALLYGVGMVVLSVIALIVGAALSNLWLTNSFGMIPCG